MTKADALAYLKTVLGLTDTSQDTMLNSLLDMAAMEILNYKYSYIGIPTGQTVPDTEDAMTWVYSVVEGFSRRGAEDQTSHNENQIYRTFKHEDMIAYIRARVIPYAKVV
jgi:hypothetical protein